MNAASRATPRQLLASDAKRRMIGSIARVNTSETLRASNEWAASAIARPFVETS
jgi:hypothetical protein